MARRAAIREASTLAAEVAPKSRGVVAAAPSTAPAAWLRAAESVRPVATDPAALMLATRTMLVLALASIRCFLRLPKEEMSRSRRPRSSTPASPPAAAAPACPDTDVSCRPSTPPVSTSISCTTPVALSCTPTR